MRSIAKITIILSMAGSVTGCGLFPPTLVDEGIVKTEIVNSRPVSVSSANVYREDNLTVVRGEARYPMGVHFGMFSGHIDIDFILPSGKSVQKHDIRLTRKRIPKRIGRKAVFISRFSVDPPRGTIVRIAYHIGGHES